MKVGVMLGRGSSERRMKEDREERTRILRLRLILVRGKMNGGRITSWIPAVFPPALSRPSFPSLIPRPVSDGL